VVRQVGLLEGNEANPTVGCRAQQTCKVSSGENRRSREERQGRNESGAWQLRAEGGGSRRIVFRDETTRPLSQPALRSTGKANRHQERTLDADVDGGAIFGQPQERNPDSTVDCASPARAMGANGRKGNARAGTCLRGRGEGQEGQATGRPDPLAHQLGKPLAGQCRCTPLRHKGHGGHARKANDSQPVLALATPRCDTVRSSEDATDPEDPANSREAAPPFEAKLTCSPREPLKGTPNQSPLKAVAEGR
jgi:hypothetical protein